MKKVYFLVLMLIGFSSLIAEGNTYVENAFSFYNPEVLALGNSYVAEAKGLESFEFNPAGLMEEAEITVLSVNFNLISNVFTLSDDLLDVYNENETNSDFLGPKELIYLFQKENIPSIVGALIKQSSGSIAEGSSNGLGMTPVLSLGYAGNGFGLGFLLNMDTEFIGSNLSSTELGSVVTAGLMVGYARSIDLGLLVLDLGISARPMYKIRANSKLSDVMAFIVDDDTSDEDFLKSLDYLTGIGMGWDIGAKLHLGDLTLALAFLDMFGTNMTYSNNTYDNISNGIFLGGEEVADTYTTPMSIKLGLSYNPDFGMFKKVLNPTISTDYSLPFVDEATVEDYVNQGFFWSNLSLGLDFELFEFLNLRGGLNEGYVTLGLGLEIFWVELNAAMYSKELGSRVGERQQMGAVIEFAIRI